MAKVLISFEDVNTEENGGFPVKVEFVADRASDDDSDLTQAEAAAFAFYELLGDLVNQANAG
jgi:hypothetical protein